MDGSILRDLERHDVSGWLAVLRALEIEQARRLRHLCRGPILDLVCGDGSVASKVFDRPDVGIDTAPETLLRARAVYRLTVRAEAHRLPFRSRSFQTVYSNSALEHLPHLPRVLSEVERVLAPDGVFLFLVPSRAFARPMGLLGKLLGRRCWDEYSRLQAHLNLLDAREWRTRLQGMGFRVSVCAYGTAHLARALVARDILSNLELAPRVPPVRIRDGREARGIRARLPAPALRETWWNGNDGPWLVVTARKIGVRRPAAGNRNGGMPNGESTWRRAASDRAAVGAQPANGAADLARRRAAAAAQGDGEARRGLGPQGSARRESVGDEEAMTQEVPALAARPVRSRGAPARGRRRRSAAPPAPAAARR